MATFGSTTATTSAAASKKSESKLLGFINPKVKYQGEMRAVKCEFNSVFSSRINDILFAVVAANKDITIMASVTSAAQKTPVFAGVTLPEVKAKDKPAIGYINYSLVDDNGEEFPIRGVFALTDTPLNRNLVKAAEAGHGDKLQWELSIVAAANGEQPDDVVDADTFGFDFA